MSREAMNEIIKQAEILKRSIKRESKNIDNPVLTTYIIVELDNLIEYLQDED